MTGSLVSCVVPVFNGERFLGEALDSILAQTYAPLEVVVVDDGSTDGTAGVVARYDGRIHYLAQGNQGPAATRNAGVKVARGSFIAFLDADDLWHPEKCALQMRCFDARPELDLCVTHVENFWVAELRREAERLRDHPRSRPMAGYVTQALMARRAVFDRLGGFDPRLPHGDSTDWFLRARAAGAVMELLPETLVYRRMHPANRTRLLGANSRDQYLRIVKQALDGRRADAALVTRPSETAADGGAD